MRHCTLKDEHLLHSVLLMTLLQIFCRPLKHYPLIRSSDRPHTAHRLMKSIGGKQTCMRAICAMKMRCNFKKWSRAMWAEVWAAAFRMAATATMAVLHAA